MLLLALLLVPVAAAIAAALSRRPSVERGLLVGAGVAHFALTVGLWVRGPHSFGPYLGIDPLGLIFLSLTSALFLFASLYAVDYLAGEQGEGRRWFVPCLLLFLAAMTAVTATQHLALIWAAIEATTLASAPLIYFHRKRAALEATWKYLLICSVGIALALLGTFFVGIAASAAPSPTTLRLASLARVAPQLAAPWLKAGFVLALVGYGTKMGLAPLHTWLPDAHSQAPSPVSALLSGALLNCAFLGILRFYQVCMLAGQAAFAQGLLVALGFVSLAVAAAFIVGQRDYKRLLAYSSVENMGIVAAGVGLGGAATYGAMLHAVNHSLAKAGLFLLAGNVLRAFGTTSARSVRGVGRRLPVTGALLVAAMLAIGGAPPFGAFLSELVVLKGAMAASPWLGATFAALLAIAFLGMAGVLLPMTQGPSEAPRAKETTLSLVPPAVLLFATLALGLVVPSFLSSLLQAASTQLGGGH